MFNIRALTSVVPGWATMKPNTALGFIGTGAALWLIQLRRGELSSPRQRHILVARILSAVVGLVGLLTLAEYLFYLNLGIDTALFSKTLLSSGESYPGRMALATAFGFVLLSASLLLTTTRESNFAQSLGLLTSLNGFVASVGYLLGVNALHDVQGYSSVALHTAILLFLMGLATVAARPEAGLMVVITSAYLGGVMARR